jgi:hypothetical protein
LFAVKACHELISLKKAIFKKLPTFNKVIFNEEQYMAGTPFTPVDELNIFCRFCQKTYPAQLDRSIAGNGRIVDKESTFEYFCTKCRKTFCFSGKDLVASAEAEKEAVDPREYIPKEHYLIGEKINHKKFKDIGFVVGKDRGSPARILVQFEKSGLKKLVEDI